MSQPPPNFDPTATLLPRVDAPISVQTGGGYYDTKVSEETEQVENTKKITQSGGDFTADEKAILAKYSIGPKLQAQIGETTLREFIQQIQSPKCSAGAGAGILLHKDCWAVQAVITHLLRASLPNVVRKSNIDADIRYQSIPVSDTIDLSMEGFGAMFSKGTSAEEGKLPEPTKLFLKQKELYQLVEKVPFMAIQVVLRGEIKQANDIPATMEIQKKITEVQQFKKDRDAMMKKVAEGKVLASQLEKILREKRAKTPGSVEPTLMNDYISDIIHSKTFFQEFEEDFQDSKILSFEIIRDFKGISEGVNEHIRQLEKKKHAIDPSFFHKVSQKIKPSDEVKHIQESYKVLVSKEEKIDYLHSLQSKGIFSGFPFDTIIQDYTNASYSQKAQDHLYYDSVISQLKYLEEMDSEENKSNIPFKTLYNDCILQYSTIQDIPTLQKVYDRMNNIETASKELLRAANQLEDLATRVNMVVEKIEKEKKGLEKQAGGAIDKTKDILPQLNDITEEAYEIKEEIEVIIGVNGNPGTAERYDANLKDLVVLLKEYNTRIGDLQKDLNEALSILNPSFSVFKKKTDLQTKITEEIKVDILKTKKSEMLEVLGSEIQELLSTPPAEAFFSDEEVKIYTDFYNSSLVKINQKKILNLPTIFILQSLQRRTKFYGGISLKILQRHAKVFRNLPLFSRYYAHLKKNIANKRPY